MASLGGAHRSAANTGPAGRIDGTRPYFQSIFIYFSPPLSGNPLRSPGRGADDTMADLMEQLQQFAQKIEKKAPMKLTEEEKVILEEIEAQKGELEQLQQELEGQQDFIEVAVASTFGFHEEPEDKDNMSIEILAEMLQLEGADNAKMIKACESFVKDNASTMVQRVYRGHLGRRKYKLRYDVVWAQKAEKHALTLQAGFRGMKGRDAARVYAQKREDETRQDASKQVQRIFRGFQDKRLVAGMQKEVRKVDRAFFRSKGASENTLFRKRNFLATDEDEASSTSSDSDDEEHYIPTKHPTTGQKLTQAPQYGAKLKEKRRNYHYPASRAPKEDSFDEDSSADEHQY